MRKLAAFKKPQHVCFTLRILATASHLRKKEFHALRIALGLIATSDSQSMLTTVRSSTILRA